MRLVLALTILVLLVSGAVIGVDAAQQLARNQNETAVSGAGVQLASLQAEPAGGADEPVNQDLPGEDEPGGGASDARAAADALMAGVLSLLAEVEAAQSADALLPATAAAQDPYPVEEAQPAAEGEPSAARKLAAELMASAMGLFESLQLSVVPQNQAAAAQGQGLLVQVQSLLAQITGPEAAVAETAVPEWMPGKPDCSAEPAPGVNWSYCDKSGIELNGANLMGANLMGANFSGASLTSTDLSGAHLAGANFSEAELFSVLMRHSNLAGADFSDALLFISDLSNANLSEANFSGADVLVVVARHSKLIDADFSGAVILYSDLSLSDFSGAQFAEAQVLFNFFRESIFKEAAFTNATVAGADLLGAEIPGLDLSGSTLMAIWFKGAAGEPSGSTDLSASQVICPDGSFVEGPLTTDAASLCEWPATAAAAETITAAGTPDCAAAAAPGVNWSGCDKSGLNFVAVDLQHANLAGADFSGSTFYMSDLRHADLSGAILDGAAITFSNLSEANLSGASLDSASLLASNLVFAGLSTADLRGLQVDFTTFWGSDLSETELGGAAFRYSDLSYANLNETNAAGIELLVDFMRGANLTAADLSAATGTFVELSAAQIEELDLSAAALAGSIWLKGANGVPTSSTDLSLAAEATLICPAGEAIFGPLTTDAASLCQWRPCWSGIVDGDFEARSDAWYLPPTEYTAVFTQEQANSPDWSVRTGIINPEDNIFSFSSVRQRVTIPAGTDPAILTFYLYPQTDEPANLLIPASLEEAMAARDTNTALGGPGSAIGDAQWVIILDGMGRELLRPISMRSNSQTWEFHEVDLSHLASPHQDRTIEVYFGTFNNGHSGVTGLYVDDVTLGTCPGVPAPPVEPLPQVCSQVIVNGGFEVEDTWMLPVTPYPADYSGDQANSGVQSMRTGITDPEINVESFSSAVQKVTIPADANEAALSFYLYPQSTEVPDLLIPESMEEVMAPGARSMNYGDAQWAILLNRKGQQIERLVSMRSDARVWNAYEFDLLPYRGHTILLYFSTFNNGWDGRTAMFVDDVALNVCAPETAEPVMALTDLERGE